MNIARNVKLLKEDVENKKKIQKFSLSRVSKKLGWSANRLGQILKADDMTLENLKKITTYFNLDPYKYCIGGDFTHYWRAKHLISNADTPYFQMAETNPQNFFEIICDRPIAFKRGGQSYHFPSGTNLIVEDINKEYFHDIALYAYAAKKDSPFKIAEGWELKYKKPSLTHVYQVIGVRFASLVPTVSNTEQ